MADRIITFKTFDNLVVAHIERTKLEAHGIPCFLADEHIIGLSPFYNPAVGGVKLKIFEKDYLRCMELNSDYNEDAEEIPANTCPLCNSYNIKFRNAGRKDFRWFSLLACVLFSGGQLNKQGLWHCDDCNKDFQ